MSKNTIPETISDILDNGVAVPTILEITENFVQSEYGSKGNDLLNIAKITIRNFSERPFSLNDFVIMSLHLDIETDIVTAFFAKWVTALKKSGRVIVTEPKNSAYEYEIYSFIN